MSVAIKEYNRSHRLDFAQQFCLNAEFQSVFMGFFDCAQRKFSDAWVAQTLNCTQDSIRNLVRMAETRLIAHVEQTKRQAQMSPNSAPDPNSEKIYPTWISNGHNVVGIGAPITEFHPVIAFPRFNHNDAITKQPLLRIGMAYVNQQLAESVGSETDWPIAALNTTVNLFVMHAFLVSNTGLILYSHGQPLMDDTHSGHFLVGEYLSLPNRHENKSIYDSIRIATQDPCDSTMLSINCFGTPARAAIVAPISHAGRKLALVLLGRSTADHRLRREQFFNAYQMTHSERLVTSELLQGRQLNEISDSTGLSLSTVRSYLKQIFIKTQTHRQIDLLILYYSS